MPSITIRGCCIGTGRPKVILPIVAVTEEDILREAVQLAALRADCIEWRADYFPAALDSAALSRVLHGLRAALGEKLLLVTFRTKAEGGQLAPTPQQYADFCGAVCASGCADLLDIEFFPNREHLSALIEQAHQAGVAVVCSSHDFAKTPPCAEMVARLTEMQKTGADLSKLAVMPSSRADVLELLTATAITAEQHARTPIITISMEKLGSVSRLCCKSFGSAMTFANPGQASAPGQVSLDVVNLVLDTLTDEPYRLSDCT